MNEPCNVNIRNWLTIHIKRLIIKAWTLDEFRGSGTRVGDCVEMQGL